MTEIEPTLTRSATTTLTDDLYNRLCEEASEQDRNISSHLRRIVKEHFARQDVPPTEAHRGPWNSNIWPGQG